MAFTKDEVKLIKSELLHDGFCRVERQIVQYPAFTGGWIQPQSREFLKKPYAVAVIPYDPQCNSIVLVEQFRIGALVCGYDPWLLEVVAGVHDQAGETCEELVRRELREEVGLEAEAVVPVLNYLASPGCSSEEIKLYCAKVDSKKAPAFCGLQGEGEDIRVHVLPVEQAIAAVKNARIGNGVAIIALQWLELNIASLRKLWQ